MCVGCDSDSSFELIHVGSRVSGRGSDGDRSVNGSGSGQYFNPNHPTDGRAAAL